MTTKRLLGRTNRALYPLWAKGTLKGTESAEVNALRLFQQILKSPVEVLDITPAPGLWGHLLREHPTPLQVAITVPPHLIGLAGDATRAGYALQSHLIETLCAIGRERVDFYFLSLHESLTEAQLSGALEALEIARQEGQIGAIGLAGYENPIRTLALWRTHDAFEVVLIPNEETHLQTLLPEARYRRAGIVVELNRPLQMAELESQIQHYGADALLAPIAL